MVGLRVVGLRVVGLADPPEVKVGLRVVGPLVVGLVDVEGAVGVLAIHTSGLKPPLRGVHLSTLLEYMPLQHPFMHCEFEEHNSQSLSDPVVGGVTGGGVGVVGLVVTGVVGAPAEHPAVFLTSPSTVSLHAPAESSLDTQKKAPPLHANSLLLYVLRSAIIFAAVAAFTFEPEPPQSSMQWPKITCRKIQG